MIYFDTLTMDWHIDGFSIDVTVILTWIEWRIIPAAFDGPNKMLSVVCKLRGECQRVQNAIEKYGW